MTTLELIRQFLDEKRIAIIGASRHPKEFSRSLMAELQRRGVDVVPVNLHAPEIDGVACARSILEVTPKVSAAIIMTPKYALKQSILECISAGVTTIWLFGLKGPGEFPADMLELCANRGVKVIPGYCPYMFMDNAGWFHRLHGSFNRMFGEYPI